MRSMIICVKSSFHNTPVQSVLKNKNQSLSRFVVQTLLATIVLLDDHSLGVRSFKEKRLLKAFVCNMSKNITKCHLLKSHINIA